METRDDGSVEYNTYIKSLSGFVQKPTLLIRTDTSTGTSNTTVYMYINFGAETHTTDKD